MAKVYVVTSGEYSDFGILGIFSTREAAERIASVGERYTRYGQPPNDDIEEYELDEMAALEVGPVYYASVRMEDGSIILEDEEVRLRHPTGCEFEENAYVDRGVTHRGHIAVGSPISMEHAAKVAAERRQKWLREHAQPEVTR